MLISTTGIQGRMVGQYMVANGGNSPNRIKVFDIETRAVGTYTIKDNMASFAQPSVSFTNCYRWNANGTTLLFGRPGTPFVNFYNKVGNTYTALGNISPLGSGAVFCADWHPNNIHIAAGSDATNNTTGQVRLIKRSGDTFTSITGTFNVAITGTIQISDVAWNPQGDTLAISCYQTPYLLLYKFNPETDSFTKIVDPSNSMPAGVCDGVAWNHDGSSLVVTGRQASNQIIIYNRSGDSFVRCFTGNIGANVVGVDWGGNGEHIIFAMEASPRVGWYYRPPGTTSTFHRAANPTTLPPNNGTGVGISEDGLFAAVSVYLNAAVYYRRDPATTSTWINIGQNITGNPVYGKKLQIYQGIK